MSNRISVMVISGSRERLQMAAMVASVGAVSGNEVHVFLSMNALTYFVKSPAKEPSAEGSVGTLLAQKKAPPFRELFANAVDLGDAKIYPCSMAMDVLALEQKDLEDFVGAPMGLTKFLDEASSGQVWSF
ncbi:MAG TPA: DsrE/DsrF/DrsH-like family protein [Burkholderiales bacterium]|nr:DsrE/DsrF/DrsH-like family protein [Burkholderiales bacterium]